MSIAIPARVAASCAGRPEREAWLLALPGLVEDAVSRWSLTVGAPFDGPEVSAAWAAPAVRSDGSRAVLKVGMPHFEGADEIAALRFWDGEPTVRLLDADDGANAMLLEACEPGEALRALPEPEQDLVLAGLLRRMWRVPPASTFRPLGAMTAFWRGETLADEQRWPDAGLVREGLRLMTDLAAPSDADVLLATDLHAGNVLRAAREPWLVIDPKPFTGDAAYDATQHLFNCRDRLVADPLGLIARFAGLLGVDAERVRLWTFARAAAESRDDWDDPWAFTLARRLAP